MNTLYIIILYSRVFSETKTKLIEVNAFFTSSVTLYVTKLVTLMSVCLVGWFVFRLVCPRYVIIS